ncbi:MAG: alpha/beta fold hydrolase [Kofleriaceae bacterium]
MRSGALVAMLFVGACSFHPSAESGDDTPSPDAPPVQPDAPPPVPHGPYPLVLAHGLFGFKNVGPLDYFYGITGALQDQGRTVFTPRVDAVQSAAVRGQQLVDQIEMIKQMTGAPKVVIIGHSQGGLDARWAAAHDPGSIAAVVTVATPHRGSPVADVALGVLPGDSSAALDVLGNLIGLDTDGSSTSFAGALHDLSSDGAAQFNADNPNVAGMPYFSIAGRSNLAGASACPPAAAQFMTTWDSSVDPMKAVLSPVSGILALAALPDTPVQDGLVTIDSAQWGQFLGCVPADHFDEVCQIAGQDPGLGNDYSCLDMWRGIEQFLRSQDL